MNFIINMLHFISNVITELVLMFRSKDQFKPKGIDPSTKSFNSNALHGIYLVILHTEFENYKIFFRNKKNIKKEKTFYVAFH